MLRLILITLLLTVCLLATPSNHATAQLQPHASVPQDLGVIWRFALDRTDEGITQQWFSKRFPEFIKLPGILQAQ
ncbi:MAG TPA: hypothetical protein VGW58_17665, partial [Pyrinomonadaceae bacterium]|nr:hypothetical protein [Pyrinomonadaceae bacterium]